MSSQYNNMTVCDHSNLRGKIRSHCGKWIRPGERECLDVFTILNQTCTKKQEEVNEKLIVEKVETGNFITAGFVKDKRLTTLKIESSGTIVTFEQQGKGSVEKISLDISYEKKGIDEPTTWTLNNKSRNALIDIFGEDTNKWVGKIVEIKLDGAGEYEHITVDTMRTRE